MPQVFLEPGGETGILVDGATQLTCIKSRGTDEHGNESWIKTEVGYERRNYI
jgi:hypothetical protein